MPDVAHLPADYTAALVLSSGEVFYGYGAGAHGTQFGEICFNTAMTGYQEILTDPSYAGQIIAFTFPHIGNVGCNTHDVESRSSFISGVILREPITEPSNYRSENHLAEWLAAHGKTAICGIDTRRLTRLTRLQGPQNVAIYYPTDRDQLALPSIKTDLALWPVLEDMELVEDVTADARYVSDATLWQFPEGYGEARDTQHHVVAIDYGVKRNILRALASRGCKITVVPAETSAADILALKPDGVFLSNGPGDPEAVASYAIPTIRELIAKDIPLFGICLGHQLLALALGGKTEKMHQGHRGANHPIQQTANGLVEITSQNHGFVVAHSSLPDTVEITHLSLFDGTIAGLRMKDKPVFSVQYHPESSPGPHDSRYLFDAFLKDIKSHAA